MKWYNPLLSVIYYHRKDTSYYCMNSLFSKSGCTMKNTLALKKYYRWPGVVANACNPSTLGGGDRRIRVHSQPQRACARDFSLSLSLSLSLCLPSEALRNFVRPGFKNKA